MGGNLKKGKFAGSLKGIERNLRKIKVEKNSRETEENLRGIVGPVIAMQYDIERRNILLLFEKGTAH